MGFVVKDRRTQFVFTLLALVWVIIFAWQIVEHQRVVSAARNELRNTARDVTTTLGIVMRSQRRFGVISRERLDSALNELIRANIAKSIALLNASGEVVASAGPEIEALAKGVFVYGQSWEYWGRNEIAIQNIIDLGTNVEAGIEVLQPTIIVPTERLFPHRGTNNMPQNPPLPPTQQFTQPGVPFGVSPEPPPTINTFPPPFLTSPPVVRPEERGTVEDRSRPNIEQRRGRFPRPFWITEKEYQELLQKQGVHAIVVVLPTEHVRAVIRRDLWLRFVITFFATVSVIGVAMAWNAQLRASELEMRLVRASELNTILKEMNLAAAGLAHETKNPLNVIRAQAQLLAMDNRLPEEAKQVATRIIEQVDRVAAQLNEFINFSRPRQIRKSSVKVQNVIEEVLRTLSFDIEEKQVTAKSIVETPQIEADEQLLRQVLFNLILNSIQAVAVGGLIEIIVRPSSATEAILEVRDNGPGVPPEYKEEIFKPYFTTNQKGTGLGLAIVRQIVLAHGWEIEYVPNTPTGAIFRISHIKIV